MEIFPKSAVKVIIRCENCGHGKEYELEIPSNKDIRISFWFLAAEKGFWFWHINSYSGSVVNITETMQKAASRIRGMTPEEISDCTQIICQSCKDKITNYKDHKEMEERIFFETNFRNLKKRLM